MNTNKIKIVQTATALFAKYGIKSVDISRIAKDAEVSEKAIETEFNSMEQLLEACLQHEIKLLETEVSEAVWQAQSSLELLTGAVSTFFAGLSRFCTAFYCDLRKFPLIQKQVFSYKEKIQNRCIDYFMECEKDGYFTKEFNMESVALIYFETVGNIEYKYQANVIRLFLKSICTEKGVNEISRIETERNFL